MGIFDRKPNVEKLEKKRDIEGLIEALQYRKDLIVRGEAASALGRIGYKRAAEPLVQALKDEDSYVRQEAAIALGNIGDVRGVRPLIKLSRIELVESRAVQALCEIKDVGAVEPLSAALRYADGRVGVLVVTLLGHHGKAAVTPLVHALGHKDVRVCDEIMRVLAKIEDPAVIVEPLIEALKDENERTRWLAAKILGHARDARAVEPLIRALTDDDDYVRDMAAEALGWIQDARAVEPLIRVMKKGYDIPDYATKALSHIGKPAVDPLIQAFKDRDPNVRYMVLEILTDMFGGDSNKARGPIVELLRNEKDESVRNAAKRFLGFLPQT